MVEDATFNDFDSIPKITPISSDNIKNEYETS